MNKSFLRPICLAVLAIALFVSVGCGKKADPRPPAASLQGEQTCQVVHASGFGRASE